MIALRENLAIDGSESLRDLIGYLQDDRHPYLRRAIEQLDRLAERIARSGQIPPRLVDRLQRELLRLEDILETHLSKQECWLFPLIRQATTQTRELHHDDECRGQCREAMALGTCASQEALTALERVQICLQRPEWSEGGFISEQLTRQVRELELELRAYGYVTVEVAFPQVHELLLRRPR
jgi:hypothetical protein